MQIERPGSASYVTWQHGVRTLQATFTPDAGSGTYRFKARLRLLSNGAASGYSAVKSIAVS